MLTIDLATAGRVDQACDRFEKSWRSNTPVTIEEVLQQFSGTERDCAVRELLPLELELRLAGGEDPQKAEYLARLPDFAEVIRDMFDSTMEGLVATMTAESPRHATVDAGRNANPEEKAQVPERIGKYRIIEKLDRGGQATVYRAVHPELGRDVVIKFSHEGKAFSPEVHAAMLAEGRVLAGLEHPNLARVYDCDFHEDRAYLVMEYVRGKNLEQFAKQSSPKPETWIPLVRKIAQALDYVHSRGVLHLDLKPRNILIDESGQPHLIDFGLARTESAWEQSGPNLNLLCGTVPYAAPEQARCEAEAIGPRSDVFGLGGVLFYLATGKPPVPGTTFSDVLANAKMGRWDRQRLAGSPIDSRLRAVIESALAIDANQRIASAGELAERLAELEAPAPSTSTATTGNRFGRRPFWAVSAALVAAVTLLSIATILRHNSETPSILATPDTEFGEMQVRVWRAGDIFDLGDAIPIDNRDRIEVRAQIPAGMHVALFSFDTEGALRLIESFASAKESFEYRFPRDKSHFEKIVGPAGTEFLFLCGNHQRAVVISDLEPAELWTESWPELPYNTAIRINSNAVEYINRTRGLGGGVATVDSQQQVFDRLERLRSKLQQAHIQVEGLAFAHTK